MHGARLETGIAGLDRILDGGLLPGGLYLLAGCPGSGKTVLSNQVCFELARRGAHSLYLTLLTESHARMVQNTSSFAFFDRAAVGASIVYASAHPALRDRGLDGLRLLIDAEIQRLRPTLVVIDGITAVSEAAASNAEFRHFLGKLRATLELHGATALLCMPAPEHDQEATQTMADGVLVLVERTVGRRSVRELSVAKFRGSTHLGGPHVFEIGRDGIRAYPRAEAILGRGLVGADASQRRMRFGVARLDEMLCGGLPSASSTAIVGAPGSGKTLLGLHFLAAGAARRENGLYLGFYEMPERLLGQAERIGIPLRRLREQGRVGVRWIPPYENLLDPLVATVLEEVERRRVRRLFIDGLEGLTMSIAFGARVPAAINAFANELRVRGVTTLLSIESPILHFDAAPFGPESAFVENLILLRYVRRRAQLERLLSIVKVRGSDFDSSAHEFRIGPAGIEVERSSDSAEAILADMAAATSTTISPMDPADGSPAAARRGARR